MDNLRQRLTSKGTWQRAWFLMRYHDPGEVPKVFKKEDYLPLALAIGLSVLGMIMFGILAWIIFH